MGKGGGINNDILEEKKGRDNSNLSSGIATSDIPTKKLLFPVL